MGARQSRGPNGDMPLVLKCFQKLQSFSQFVRGGGHGTFRNSGFTVFPYLGFNVVLYLGFSVYPYLGFSAFRRHHRLFGVTQSGAFVLVALFAMTSSPCAGSQRWGSPRPVAGGSWSTTGSSVTFVLEA